MVDRSARSPDNVWQWLFGAGEERLGQFAEEVIGNPRVREALAAAFRRAARTKGQVDRNMEMILAALNLPTRSDFDKLYAKVEALQGSLVNLSIKLDRLAAAQAARPEPPARAVKRPRRAARKKSRSRRASGEGTAGG
jgi:hypothetical protein